MLQGALMMAEPGSVEMAYAHANRAAALMKVEYYQEAIMDCEIAIKYEHPDQFKNYERICQCNLNLKDKENLKKTLKRLESLSKKKPDKYKIDSVAKFKMSLKDLEVNGDEKKKVEEGLEEIPKDTIKM